MSNDSEELFPYLISVYLLALQLHQKSSYLKNKICLNRLTSIT